MVGKLRSSAYTLCLLWTPDSSKLGSPLPWFGWVFLVQPRALIPSSVVGREGISGRGGVFAAVPGRARASRNHEEKSGVRRSNLITKVIVRVITRVIKSTINFCIKLTIRLHISFVSADGRVRLSTSLTLFCPGRSSED